MLKSMTGFGRYEETTDQYKISVEMKAVNHRYCDITVKMPRCYNFLEERIRQTAAQSISRGKVEILISIHYCHSQVWNLTRKHRILPGEQKFPLYLEITTWMVSIPRLLAMKGFWMKVQKY